MARTVIGGVWVPWVLGLGLGLAALPTSMTVSGTGVCPRIVSRDDWGARLPMSVQQMRNPVSSVVIHHTYLPSHCETAAACEAAMRNMQDMHQKTNGWADIGYSFAIGGDGRVYKGRGWNRVGAHAPPYNFDSIGITFIGDWRDKAPPTAMLDAAQWLIKCGVETGHISPRYQLLGHRQAKDTECPGDALFNVIQTWEHFTADPVRPKTMDTLMDTLGDTHSHSARHFDIPAPIAVKPTPALEGSYDPATPEPERDAVEVRQLNKRSLWDRLVQIWQKEAMRQASQAASQAASSS